MCFFGVPDGNRKSNPSDTCPAPTDRARSTVVMIS
jgi:hypothetical protein